MLLIAKIKSRFIFCLFVAALLFFAEKSLLAARCEGGSCEGGGSVIQFEGQSAPFLLDRLTLTPSLATNPEPIAKKPRDISESSALIKKTSEIAPIGDEDKAAFNLARKKLENWKNIFGKDRRVSKALMQIIENAINEMSYLRTTYLFNSPPRYKLEEDLQKKNPKIETAILYVPRYGAIISAPVWDKLDTETQAGLIIHEAIRQIQGMHSFVDIKDVQLQMIVAKIMDESPSSKASFEPWMSNMLQRYCMVKSTADLPENDPDASLKKIATDLISIQKMIEAFANISQKSQSCELAEENAEQNSKRQQLLQDLFDKGILRK